MSIISEANLDEASAAELQKYMEDHGVVELRMNRKGWQGVASKWFFVVKMKDGKVHGGGPCDSMGDCMKEIIKKLEEA